MPIVYHGDDYGTTKLDPRWMFHEESGNLVGIGIYFTPVLEEAFGYGPKIISINTDNLKIFRYDFSLNFIQEKKIVNFLEFLHKNKAFSKSLKLRYDDLFFLKKLKSWERDLIELFSNKRFDEKVLNKVLYPYFIPSIGDWQNFLAIIYGVENIITFVHGWNKYIKIDGLTEKRKNSYMSIIQTKVKVTPVNF